MDLYIEAPWTWNEFLRHADEIFSELRALGKPCATTVDVSRIGTLPKGNVLRYLTEIENLMPQNVFASAMIGAPYALTIFMEIIMRMRPRAKRIALFAKSHPEAHEKIREKYAQLTDVNEKAS